MKEKMIELLMQKGFGVEGATIAADQLISNGVTIPVRCGDCIHRIKGHWVKCIGRRPDEFCSSGESRWKHDR